MNKSSSAIEDILPLSPMQKGILAHSLRPEAASTYVVAAHIRWHGALDPQTFSQAWQDLAERHVALRSLFVWEGVREPVAVVKRPDAVPTRVEVRDLRAEAPSPEVLEAQVLAAYQESFDLSKAPLMRHILLRTGDTTWSWIWVHHHLILDGWCLPLLLKAFFAGYQARGGKLAPQSPPVVANVRDYIKWKRTQNTQRAKEHWQRLLGDLVLPTPLPMDRGETGRCGVDAVRGELDPVAQSALVQGAARLGVTVNTLFQAAWALVLRAYCGRSTAVFGMTYSGRVGKWPGLASVLTVCIDTVPVRVDIDPAQTIKAWLDGILSQAQVAQGLAAVGMQGIRELCQGQPFESIVVFENYPLQGLFEQDNSDVAWELVSPQPGGVLQAHTQARNNFPLTVVVDPGSDGALSWILAYQRGRFERESMQGVSEQLRVQLRRLLDADSSARVGDLWNDASQEGSLVPEHGVDPSDWLYTHAQRRPQALAVVAGEQRRTFGELAQAVARGHRALRAQGVRVGDRVGLDLVDGAEWIASIFAIWACGAAYVPVDPAWPQSRKAQILADAQVKQSLCVNHSGPEALRPSTWWGGQAFALPRSEHPGVLPAYLIYTSGSSGQPKGVVVDRAALSHYCRSMIARLELDAAHRFAFVSSPASDLGHTSVFLAMALGATLHWVGPQIALCARSFAAYNQAEGLDVVKVTPSQLSVWLDCEEPRHVLPRRHLISGGEAVPASMLRSIFRYAPSPAFGVWNHYGPTETTVGVCVHRVQSPDDLPVPVGRALDHVRCTLVDERGSTGVQQGELYIGGPSVAQGYWNKPRETALSFRPDAAGQGARVYASGDKLRRRPDDALLFLGRIDAQLSIRGHRVEPQEIEAQLEAHPAVARAVVVARSGQDASRLALVACWVPRGEGTPSAELLMEWLAQRLPEAMVPQVFESYPRLPLLENGKVDRKSLRERSPTSAPHESAQSAGNELESLLLSVFQAVLGQPDMGVTDNLFALGGDSIHSLRIAGRAKKLGVPLTPQMIFKDPTVAGLARALASGGKAQTPEPVPALLPDLALATAPLLPSQRHFFAQARPDAHHFNLSFVIDLPRPPGDVSGAFAKLVQRHPALSLRVDARGQQVHARPELLLRYFHEREFAEQWVAMQGSLDPQKGPALRAVWVQGSRPMLWVVAHHLVMDVVSAGVLREEYLHLLAGKSLPEPGPSVLDWGQWWIHHAKGQARARGQLDHWLRMTQPLRGQPALPLQTLAEVQLRRVVVDSATTQRWSKVLDRGQAYRWDALVLSAWAQALFAVVDQGQLVFECEGHGRDPGEAGVDLSKSVGWFTTRYPVRIDRSAGVREGFELTQRALLATPQGGLGYAYLRYVDQSPEARELAQISAPYFCYNHLGQLGDAVDPLTQRAQRSSKSLRAQWIEVTSFIQGQELVIEWRDAPGFAPAGWEEVDLAAIFASFQRNLQGCIEALNAAPGEDQRREKAMATTPSCPSGTADLSGLAPASRDTLQEALAAAGIESETVVAVGPCTPAQAGIWAATRMAGPDAQMYWNHSEWELAGVSVDQLRAAFTQLMQRHEVLRSRWLGEGLKVPVMVVLREAPLPLRVCASLGQARSKGVPSDLGWELCVSPSGPDRLSCRWSRHHILLDGWSHGRLLAEVVALIEGTPKLAPPISYLDYLSWTQQKSRSRQAEFWRTQLDGVEPCIAAPFADPMPGLGGYRSSCSQSLRLDAALVAQIQTQARACAVTEQCLAQATFALWLSRAWGRPDPVFAMADAGRGIDFPDAERVVGMMMRVLPFVMPDPPGELGDYLRAVQERSACLRDQGDLGMSKIQALAHAAQLGLCSVLWVYENYPGAGDQPAWLVTRDHGPKHAVSSDFALVWVFEPGKNEITASYDPRVYRPAQIDAMLQSYRALLFDVSAALADPGTSVASLYLTVPPKDRAYAPAKASVALKTETIASRFARICATYSESMALCDERGSRWSYHELEQEVHRVASALRAQGVGPETAVGLCLPASADLIIAMLGVLTAGGYYVPIDPSTPEARMASMLSQVKARWVIASASAAGLPSDVSCKALTLDALQGTPDPSLAAQVHPVQLAYLIYTSGSTGAPKGVGVQHNNAIRLFDAAAQRMDFGPQDRWSLMHRHAFDFSVWEIFGPLLSGGELVIVPQCERREPAQLLTRLAKKEVSMLSLTPSALIALQRGILANPELMSSLRYIVLGGESLDVRHLDPEWATSPGVQCINMYGITETTVHVTSTRVCAEPPASGSLVGPPLPDLSLSVLDPFGHLLPRGVAGELFVGGQGVTRGYIGQARKSAERFVPDPRGVAGSRMYRTGDRGQLDAQGQWRHEGRLDQQVQIRGHRIELGEIESRLLAHPQVQAARVLTSPQERSLWGYVVPKAGQGPSVEALSDFLGQWLPDYMVPRHIMMVQGFARTVNGKLDRSQLPTPQGQPKEGRPLQTAMQRSLAQIWSEVLECSIQTRDANFFDRGGQSMAAMRVVDEVQRRLGHVMPIAKVFELPQLDAMARWIEECGEQRASDAPARQPIAAAPIKKRRRGGSAPS